MSVGTGKGQGIGQRDGGEDKHGREADGGCQPLQKDGEQTEAVAKGLANPTEDTPLLGPAGGEFGGA